LHPPPKFGNEIRTLFLNISAHTSKILNDIGMIGLFKEETKLAMEEAM
jgi:hypothetical protein